MKGRNCVAYQQNKERSCGSTYCRASSACGLSAPVVALGNFHKICVAILQFNGISGCWTTMFFFFFTIHQESNCCDIFGSKHLVNYRIYLSHQRITYNTGTCKAFMSCIYGHILDRTCTRVNRYNSKQHKLL